MSTVYCKSCATLPPKMASERIETIHQAACGTPSRCWTCLKEGTSTLKLLNCSICVTAKYCGAACQKKDWSKHKIECVNLKSKAFSKALAEEKYINASVMHTDLLSKKLLESAIPQMIPSHFRSTFLKETEETAGLPARIKELSMQISILLDKSSEAGKIQASYEIVSYPVTPPTLSEVEKVSDLSVLFSNLLKNKSQMKITIEKNQFFELLQEKFSLQLEFLKTMEAYVTRHGTGALNKCIPQIYKEMKNDIQKLDHKLKELNQLLTQPVYVSIGLIPDSEMGKIFRENTSNTIEKIDQLTIEMGNIVDKYHSEQIGKEVEALTVKERRKFQKTLSK